MITGISIAETFVKHHVYICPESRPSFNLVKPIAQQMRQRGSAIDVLGLNVRVHGLCNAIILLFLKPRNQGGRGIKINKDRESTFLFVQPILPDMFFQPC